MYTRFTFTSSLTYMKFGKDRTSSLKNYEIEIYIDHLIIQILSQSTLQ